jgi:glucose-6-phosphate dehydrogenase assembly protein OpcA
VPPKNIPRGSVVWGKGTLVAQLGRYMSIPAYAIVVLIAVVTSAGRRLPAARKRGNWLIALGATITATGGPMARYGRGVVFSILLAAGVTVMFLGFRLATRVGKAPAGSEPL